MLWKAVIFRQSTHLKYWQSNLVASATHCWLRASNPSREHAKKKYQKFSASVNKLPHTLNNSWLQLRLKLQTLFKLHSSKGCQDFLKNQCKYFDNYLASNCPTGHTSCSISFPFVARYSSLSLSRGTEHFFVCAIKTLWWLEKSVGNLLTPPNKLTQFSKVCEERSLLRSSHTFWNHDGWITCHTKKIYFTLFQKSTFSTVFGL